VREAAGLYVGCVAGAMPQDAYLLAITAAGFADVAIAAAAPIELPDPVLAAHMDPGAITAFRRTGIGLRSATVVGRKPERP
jgi:arsenite methyltransferase